MPEQPEHLGYWHVGWPATRHAQIRTALWPGRCRVRCWCGAVSWDRFSWPQRRSWILQHRVEMLALQDRMIKRLMKDRSELHAEIERLHAVIGRAYVFGPRGAEEATPHD